MLLIKAMMREIKLKTIKSLNATHPARVSSDWSFPVHRWGWFWWLASSSLLRDGFYDLTAGFRLWTTWIELETACEVGEAFVCSNPHSCFLPASGETKVLSKSPKNASHKSSEALRFVSPPEEKDSMRSGPWAFFVPSSAFRVSRENHNQKEFGVYKELTRRG